MANDRDKAFEVSDNGLVFDGAAHVSSGSGVPSHTGLKGDRYFRTGTSEEYTLLADGSSWTLVGGGVTEEFVIAMATAL